MGVSLGRREQEKVSQSFSLISPVPSENGGEDRGGGDREGALDVEQQNQEATEVDEGSEGGSTSPVDHNSDGASVRSGSDRDILESSLAEVREEVKQQMAAQAAAISQQMQQQMQLQFAQFAQLLSQQSQQRDGGVGRESSSVPRGGRVDSGGGSGETQKTQNQQQAPVDGNGPDQPHHGGGDGYGSGGGGEDSVGPSSSVPRVPKVNADQGSERAAIGLC